MLWTGLAAGLVHIGDPAPTSARRELFQNIHDHTMVQSMVDEGRIGSGGGRLLPRAVLLIRAPAKEPMALRHASASTHSGKTGLSVAPSTCRPSYRLRIRRLLSEISEPEQAVRDSSPSPTAPAASTTSSTVVADVLGTGE
ncbi:hypothetical protein LV779_25860 [Streptomyces thinghirensis]|nr:hypothetical protein [Streptomyces thinghirensis]